MSGPRRPRLVVRREPTVAVQVVHALMAREARLGPAGRPLIAKVTVGREVLEDVDGRVPAAIVRELWTDLPVACGDPFFGLTLAASVPDGALGVVAYLAQHAPTLGQGFTAAVRYARLLQDVADCFVEPGGHGGLRFVQAATARGPAPPRHAVEFAFARAILAARRSTGARVTPTQVRFAFARPATIEAYAPVFGARVSFDHRRNELELDAATLALPQREADPWLRALVEARARDLLGRLGWRRARLGLRPRWAARLLLAPPLTIPLGVVAVRLLGVPRRLIVLVLLAEICGGLAWLGVADGRGRRPTEPPT